MCRKLARVDKQQFLTHVDLQFHRHTYDACPKFLKHFHAVILSI